MRRRGKFTTRAAKRGAVAGLAGALSVVVLDSLLTRVPALNNSAMSRGLTRLAFAAAAATVADAYGAPEAVADGLFAGAVTVTALDAGTQLIASRRQNPPTAIGAAAGAPWAPQPLYAIR